jgi:hypothetical protein
MTKPSTVLEHISALLAKEPAAEARQGAGGGPETILSVTGEFAYGSMNGLFAMMARHWTAAGAQIVEIDLGTADWPDRLSAAIDQTRVRFCVSMAGVALEIAERAPSLWHLMRFPVVALHCDHPTYFARRHRDLPANFVLAYLFEDHAIYQRDHVKAANPVTSIHFGIPELAAAGSLAGDRDRAPTVVFAKTGNDPRELEAHWRTMPMLERLIHDSLDQVGLGPCRLYPAAVQKAAAAQRIELQPFDPLTRFLIVQVDDYVRRRKSTAIAQAIKRFPVDIYGDRWDHIEREGARARFHGGVAFDLVNEAIANAAASITMNPNIELSAHDRFFLALAMGVMPVTDSNAFIGENFPRLAPYTFDFADGRIEPVLERIFARPGDARELARSVKTETMDRFSTRGAAQHIRDCADLAGFFEYSFAAPQPFLAM